MKSDTIMNNMPDTSSMTLESIALQKKELRKKIHAQKEIMTDTAREILERWRGKARSTAVSAAAR